MSDVFIGRRVSVGLGVESTPGTAVAPTGWMRHTKLDFQPQTTVVENDSAMGRVEDVNDSAVVEEWAEGTLEGKVYDDSIAYLLYNIFGTLSTADNDDASGDVKDHTFSVANSNVAKTLTVARVDPNSNRRHALATADSVEISCDPAGWVMVSAKLKAAAGTTNTDTAAYTAEHSFTSKHVTLKTASDVDGLAAASAIPVKSFKLTIERQDNSMFFPMGSIDPEAINTGKFSVSGEMVLRYSDLTYETLWLGNTQQAMLLSLINGDVTIGTSAHPGLVFTAPKTRFRTLTKSDDLDTIVEQTVGFKCELDATSYLIQAVLTNLTASY